MKPRIQVVRRRGRMFLRILSHPGPFGTVANQVVDAQSEPLAPPSRAQSANGWRIVVPSRWVFPQESL